MPSASKKILWASDFPLTSQAEGARTHARAGLTDDELAAITGGNVARVLRL